MKTKKLTQGAMMLAIMGALIIIDRITAYLFTEFIILIPPVIIIMYSCMQSFKDGIYLSIGVLIIAFLLGNFQLTYLIYVPVGVITGLAYSFAIKKNADKSILILIACATYILGELVATYIIYPLLGFPISQMMEELRASLSSTGSIIGMDYASLFETAGLNLDNVLVILYLVSTLLVGAMEGILIHVISILLLKRFKIRDFERINLYKIKPNKAVAYICFIATFSFFFIGKINNEVLKNILTVLFILGAIVLIYYGYIFIVLYGSLVLKKNIGPIFVIVCLFVPAMLIGLVIIGFLYGAGPLRQKLEEKVNKIYPHE